MPTPELVLASASPRRRALLEYLGMPFTAIATDSDETRQADETAPAMVERLSQNKAHAARERYREAIIIAADTDVELDGRILGKPRDADEARAMLTALRNRAHSVYTGVTLGIGETYSTGLTRTRVWMRDYSDIEIDAYVATGDPLDKAAGYAVQHAGFRPVARVEGCFANVMGLPLCRLYPALARSLNLPPPSLPCILHPEHDCSLEPIVMADASR